MNSLAYILSEDTPDPVLAEAMRQAADYERWLKGKQLSARQAMFLVILRRVRELEAENEELRRLR